MKKIMLFVTILLCPLLLVGCGLIVKKPKVKHGKFNFAITYEYNGEISTFSGVYVCKYSGVSWALDGGFYRDWTAYIEGNEGNDYDAIIGSTNDGGIIVLSTGFYPEYFMGDSYTAAGKNPPEPRLSVIHQDEGGGTTIMSDDEVIENDYHAKIISFEYDKPIENSFK